MAEISTSRLKELLQRTVGPTPWYWKTFPAFKSASGQRFVWTHHGEQGPLAYLVSLSLEQEPEKPRLALNTYCRPFFVPPSHLGIWCPEGRSIRFVCFDPDQLKAFDFAEIAGWFKQSSERIYAATEPIADFEVALGLPPAMHKIEVPAELRGVDELIVPDQLSGQETRRSRVRAVRRLSAGGTGRGSAAEMVHRQPVPGGKAMDHAGSARSGIASDFWRVFWIGNISAGGRRMPPGAMDGKEDLRLRILDFRF